MESAMAGITLEKPSRLGLVNHVPVNNGELRTLQAGERTSPAGKPVANSILLSIPDDEFEQVRPHLQFLVLASHRTLHEPNRKLEFAYFLNSGMISLVVTTREGESVEAGVVGSEGFAPIPLAAGIKRIPHRSVIQVAGEGFRITVEALEEVLQSSPQFQKLLHRYAAVHGMQVAQTAGCNRLHNLEQRLSRWLLLIQDRVESGMLRITHDFLATMLGTDRPSVSLAAGSLQRKRIIEYTHGSVKVLNRKKLEKSACECYGITQLFNAEMGLK
jgi:CRP-like cAMP-binding protein